jgi:hypothetical protein
MASGALWLLPDSTGNGVATWNSCTTGRTAELESGPDA